MIASIDRWWRVLGTGFCFAVFGLGGTLQSFTLFPVLRLLAGSRERAQPIIRAALRHNFRLFAGLMRAVGVVSWEVHGRERLLVPGQLIVANHPTLIDVVLLLALVPNATCVVKRGLWRNPFLRWPVAWAGYIPNNDSESLIRDCSATLRAGHSLLMFPEGSRTVPGQPMQLKRGAAQIAIASGAPVLPVVITVDPLMLTKTDRWYRVPPRPGHWVIAVGVPVAAQALVRDPVRVSIAARQLTRHLAALFTRGVQTQGSEVIPVTVTNANAPGVGPASL